MHKRNLIVMNLKTLLPVAENNRPLRNEPRDLIRTRQLKEKEKKMKLNGGTANGTSGHGARGLYLTPRKRITLLGDPVISTRAGLYQAFLLTATANANLSEQNKPDRSGSYYIFIAFSSFKKH